MPSFRQRPLTWLVIIAAACLDAVIMMVGGDFDGDLEHVVIGFEISQMWLAGAWLALGTPHRLARAALFVAAVAALTALVSIGHGNGWKSALAPVTLLCVVAALAAFLANAAPRALRARSQRRASEPLRFPLVEIFGWMTVVAVSSSLLGMTNFSRLGSPYDSLLFALAASATAGMTLAIALPGGRQGWGKRIALAAFAVFAFVVVTGALGGIRERDLYYGAHWGFVFLAVVMLIFRLDGKLRPIELASEPLAEGPLSESVLD